MLRAGAGGTDRARWIVVLDWIGMMKQRRNAGDLPRACRQPPPRRAVRFTGRVNLGPVVSCGPFILATEVVRGSGVSM
jgi:hypothetical protein